jgi:hypothetical protein
MGANPSAHLPHASGEPGWAERLKRLVRPRATPIYHGDHDPSMPETGLSAEHQRRCAVRTSARGGYPRWACSHRLHNVSVAWFTRRCPIRDEERIWIDESMAWFVDVFGSGPLANPVILPTAEFFPDAYGGSREEVRRELDRVCGYMGVDPASVELELYAEYEQPPEGLPVVVVVDTAPPASMRLPATSRLSPSRQRPCAGQRR